MKQKLVTIAFMLAGAVLLAGCPKKNTTLTPATAGSQAGGGASTNANGGGASTSGSALGNGANGANGMGANGVNGGRNT